MANELWTDLVKQSSLENFYEVLSKDSTATSKEIAFRLARFAEAQIYGAADRRIADLEKRLKEALNANHPNP